MAYNPKKVALHGKGQGLRRPPPPGQRDASFARRIADTDQKSLKFRVKIAMKRVKTEQAR